MNTTSTAVPASVPRLLVTSSPHIQSGLSAARVMWDVNIALVPALAMAFYNFGGRAVGVTIASIAGALIAEIIIQKFFYAEVRINF